MTTADAVEALLGVFRAYSGITPEIEKTSDGGANIVYGENIRGTSIRAEIRALPGGFGIQTVSIEWPGKYVSRNNDSIDAPNFKALSKYAEKIAPILARCALEQNEKAQKEKDAKKRMADLLAVINTWEKPSYDERTRETGPLSLCVRENERGRKLVYSISINASDLTDSQSRDLLTTLNAFLEKMKNDPAGV